MLSVRARVIRLIFLSLFFAGGVVVWVAPAAKGYGSDLSVTFLDIGQGDAIFIESPTGVQVLIDGGQNGAVLRRLAEEMGFFDRSIDIVLATHPDKDHIGGLSDVLDRYDVSEIVLTENEGTSAAAELFLEKVSTEGAQITYARRGMQYNLGGGARLTILFPDRDPSRLESNTSSIVARLVYGNTEFLFTGDSPRAIEGYLVTLDGSGLQSDVLKVGHHGSRTSSSASFLEAVQPVYAVISSGKDNQYGHPHEEVIAALHTIGAETKNTADSGSITVISDGDTLTLK